MRRIIRRTEMMKMDEDEDDDEKMLLDWHLAAIEEAGGLPAYREELAEMLARLRRSQYDGHPLWPYRYAIYAAYQAMPKRNRNRVVADLLDAIEKIGITSAVSDRKMLQQKAFARWWNRVVPIIESELVTEKTVPERKHSTEKPTENGGKND